MDPTERFSDRVRDYVRYRPRYPAGLIPLLKEQTGLKPGWTIADIGSGTGFSAEPFVQNGNVVFGIEPNDAMREAAEQLFAGKARFISVKGTAENTTLEGNAAELVIAGQAFHWFDLERARAEFRRILKSPQWTALFWNTRRTEASPFMQAYEDLLLHHGTDYHQVRHDRTEVPDRFFAKAPSRFVLPYGQSLDYDGIRGRLLSSSYTPPEGDPRREPMLAELRRIFDTHALGGTVRLDYNTEITLGAV